MGDTVIIFRAFILLMLIQTPPLFAQAMGGGGNMRHGAGIGFGQVFMFGEFSTHFQNDVGVNLTYSYDSASRFGFFAQIHWNGHSNKNNPDDSLAIKGLVPNLKVNIARMDVMTFYIFGGLGVYKVDETYNNQNGSFTLFTIDAGAGLNAEIGPHFRCGPSLTLINVSSGTDNSSVVTSGSSSSSNSSSSTSSSGLTMGGSMVELMFNMSYLF